jgi:hypothetical protein
VFHHSPFLIGFTPHSSFLIHHQWDFTLGEDGSFVIKSPYQEINITKKFSPKARIRCEIRQEKSLSDKEFLLTEIFKSDTTGRAGGLVTREPPKAVRKHWGAPYYPWGSKRYTRHPGML